MGDVRAPSAGRRWAFSVVAVTLALAGLEGGLRLVGVGVSLHQIQRGDRTAPGEGPVVLTVGDSVTAGIPEGLPHGWPAHFARRTGATVHNLGAAGRGVGWMVQDLDRRLPALPPVDLLIAMVGHNDCAYLADLASIHMPDPPTTVDRLRRALRRLTTYRVLLQLVARVRPPVAAEVTSMARPVDGARESAFCRAVVSSGVDALGSRAERLGAELVVASYPVPARKDTPGLRVNRLVDTLLEEAALSRGLRFADTRPCFLDAPQSDWQQDGVHLTRDGYARLGHCIATALEAMP